MKKASDKTSGSTGGAGPVFVPRSASRRVDVQIVGATDSSDLDAGSRALDAGSRAAADGGGTRASRGPDADVDSRDEPQTPSDPGKQSASSPSSPNSSVDAGAQRPRDAGVVDAGARPQVDDPIGVLIDLARRSPQGKTAETIDRFLEALQKGDAPASSIRGFLLAIDEEIDCQMNPLATECLAACQAVSTTCVVCVLDEPCRSALLDICGLPALAGCTQRR